MRKGVEKDSRPLFLEKGTRVFSEGRAQGECIPRVLLVRYFAV
jgi:hypothetical protein